ncbi:MAG: hypothetical protein RL654_333 [Pseudomonadota bacterium]
MRLGQNYRLRGECYWLCDTGTIDIDEEYFQVDTHTPGKLIVCNGKFNTQELIQNALTKGWHLMDGDINILSPLLENKSNHINIKQLLAPIDYQICRQPLLEEAQFADPNKGLWEAWGQSEEDQKAFGIRPRNPALDVRSDAIAIDFGTSSTVVAHDHNGRPELMRIGVKDFWEKQQPAHYENPTVLEFIDFAAMLEAWQTTAYRPGVLWDQVRCSHEALHNWRHNESDPVVVSSILGKIKQWALRQQVDTRLRITDQKHRLEHELATLAPRNPVKGQPLTVSTDDPFDPIELYAWFLGMNINWRGRGLFLNYYMSFPVDYPQAVKDNILAAFRRGLQRSLPPTLVNQPEFSEFTVEERASEPAAYAAIALPTLDIAPGAGQGLAYAVFDFGGGTADFDYGYYREPDAQEEDAGWEAVFDRLGVAGDNFLGGENLLENMAYQTFIHNVEICRQKKIAFTCPLDATPFVGSELLLEKTRAATTNTLMMASRLRPLWETGQLADSSGVQKMDLLTREGTKVSCEIAIPQEVLRIYLAERIEKGVVGFLAGMAKAFAGSASSPQEIHVLLAGNASRSPLVAGLFGLTDNHEVATTEAQAAAHGRVQTALGDLFKGQPPRLVVHPPLAADDQDVYRPTGKTGVALGLLRLCPGGVVKVIDRMREASKEDAPFGYYVGRIRQGKYQPGLSQGARYGEWHELGMPRERVFNLVYTRSPLASTGTMKEGASDLTKLQLKLAGECEGHRVYARAIGPSRIELCTARSPQEADQAQERENLRPEELS